jgi:hypothetical protein
MKLLHLYYVSIGIHLPEHELFGGSVYSVSHRSQRLSGTDSASGERSPHTTMTACARRCDSVSFAAVPTSTERPHLSRELSEKICSKHGTGLAHAVAVTGLSGTGKTQLVPRYMEEHEKGYNSILWIDVHSKEGTRSSYERCCRELGLPVEAALSGGPLQDDPFVQAVLSWLRERGEDKRWLAVMDNADDLLWDLRAERQGRHRGRDGPGYSGVATGGRAHADGESRRDGAWRSCSPRVKLLRRASVA